jgi:hypothetical protein
VNGPRWRAKAVEGLDEPKIGLLGVFHHMHADDLTGVGDRRRAAESRPRGSKAVRRSPRQPVVAGFTSKAMSTASTMEST